MIYIYIYILQPKLGVLAFDQEIGAFLRGLSLATSGGRDSNTTISSFKASMKTFQSKISLKSLKHVKLVLKAVCIHFFT